MRKFFLSAALLLAVAAGLSAQEKSTVQDGLKAASVFTDHMVLQQNTSTRVWGWAEPGAVVTVKNSWSKAKLACTADAQGRWETRMDTPAAGGPFTMSVSSKGESLEFKDVMSGEVWLFTGQSNMEMPVKGFGSQNVEGSLQTILDAPEHASAIRVYNIKTDKAVEPQETLPCSWALSTSEVAANTSALAYMFAKGLSKSLGVTVGIIVNPWGGSGIIPWMSRDYVDKAIKGKISEKNYNEIISRKEVKGQAPRSVASMYNARMYALQGYALRGFGWYQGCSNLSEYGWYDKLQASMVECWRQMWGDEKNELPFYFTTIAPYSYGNPLATTRGYFVENQLASLDLIPNSGAAVAETLGDRDCIHPAEKQLIADQMLMMALERQYGMKTGIGSGFPYPSRVEFPANSPVETGKVRKAGHELEIAKSGNADNTIRITIANANMGLGHLPAKAVAGFEVAGPDKVFHKVKASCTYSTVTIDCEGIANPMAVRYSFHNYVDCDLTTAPGIPVPAFRTDGW